LLKVYLATDSILQRLIDVLIDKADFLSLLAGTTEIYPWNPGPECGTEAHWAWLTGADQGAVIKEQLSQGQAGFADGDNFGMSGWVSKQKDGVVTQGDNLIILVNKGPEGTAIAIFDSFKGICCRQA